MIVMLLTMLLGYFSHVIYYYGQLTVAHIKKLRRQHDYSRRMKLIEKTLNDWNTNKELKLETMRYYRTLWKRRSGIKDMPKCFNVLPRPMQKEITCDIFWEALRHSSLFSNTELPFKRAISLWMKCEFLLPGDYVYKINHYKTKMIYIVSGILQVRIN